MYYFTGGQVAYILIEKKLSLIERKDRKDGGKERKRGKGRRRRKEDSANDRSESKIL